MTTPGKKIILESGMKIKVAFEPIELGELIGEIPPDLWAIEFETRGLLVCAIERLDDTGISLIGIDPGDWVVNPTPASDFSQEDMVIMLQLATGRVFKEDLDVEGGLFKILEIEIQPGDEER